MSTVKLTAPDISCDHCKRGIERDLAVASGVRHVVVDPEAKTVDIDYDETVTDLQGIRDALAEIGYPVS